MELSRVDRYFSTLPSCLDQSVSHFAGSTRLKNSAFYLELSKKFNLDWVDTWTDSCDSKIVQVILGKPTGPTVSFNLLEKQLQQYSNSEGFNLDLGGATMMGSCFDGRHSAGRIVISNGTIVVDVLGGVTNAVLRNVEIVAPDQGEVAFVDCEIQMHGCMIRSGPMVICGRSKIEMSDCTVSHSAAHGVVLHSGEGSQLTVVNCDFLENRQSGLFVSAMFQGEKRVLYDQTYKRDAEFQPGRLTAINCRFRDNEEFGAVVIGSAIGKFTKCLFQNSQRRSGLVCGPSTNVSVYGGQFINNHENGIYIYGGGSVANIDNCRFVGSREFHGLVIRGVGTRATVTGSEFALNHKSGVLVKDGAQLTLENCLTRGSQEIHGLDVRGKGTEARVIKCDFIGNHNTNAVVHLGASAIFETCSFKGAKSMDGLRVSDAGTDVTATDCDFLDNYNDGVCVYGGAIAMFARCTLGNARTGHGLETLGKGTDVSVGNSLFTENHQSGAFAHGGATLTMDGCISRGAEKLHGVEVCELGTRASIAHCKFFDNQQNGVFIQRGAIASLKGCTSIASRTMHGIEVRDKGTQVSTTKCTFARNQWCGAYVQRGAAFEGCSTMFSGDKPGLDLHVDVKSCEIDTRDCIFQTRDTGRCPSAWNFFPGLLKKKSILDSCTLAQK